MANIPRLYVEDDLLAGDEFALSEAHAKYLLRVMRLDEGATVRAFNGRDGEWECHLRVDGRRCGLKPAVQTRVQVECPDIELLFAPLKKARTDFVVEKASELGVRRLQPVLTEYTQSERVRTDRLRATCIEAAEQTERMDIPVVAEASTLAKLLSAWDPARSLYFCDESGTAPNFLKILQDRPAATAAILIGPEGGFSAQERKTLEALDFVIPVSLGPRVLRAETAVVSALTLWQSVVGDWR